MCKLCYPSTITKWISLYIHFSYSPSLSVPAFLFSFFSSLYSLFLPPSLLDHKPLSVEVGEASALRLLGAEQENAELRRCLEELHAQQEVRVQGSEGLWLVASVHNSLSLKGCMSRQVIRFNNILQRSINETVLGISDGRSSKRRWDS